MRWLIAVLGACLLAGCGGGGGGGGQAAATLIGRVLNVETGGPTNPRSSVQAGSNSTLTSASDGSFALGVPAGTSSLTVDTLSPLGVWTFAVPPASGTTDAGDLWVGPERVVVRGFVRNASDNSGIQGAIVTFAGRTATTSASGEFVLNDVAYSSSNQTAFWGIAGFARASGFVGTEWSAQPNVAISGTVTVSDVYLSPNSDPNPPPTPYNIWGRVSPPADAPGTIVTLKQGGNTVRVFNVGADGIYRFWVNPGTYDVFFQKGSLTAQALGVVVDAPNDVEKRDVTLQ